MKKLDLNQPTVFTLQEMPLVVDELALQLSDSKVMTFTGDLGSGKTTVIKELLRHCGVKDIITSPTFTYVNVYQNDRKQIFYHFDLYRIASLQDFVHAGFDEYVYAPHSWCFIEWPSVVMPLLTHDVCSVDLQFVDENTRKITMHCNS